MKSILVGFLSILLAMPVQAKPKRSLASMMQEVSDSEKAMAERLNKIVARVKTPAIKRDSGKVDLSAASSRVMSAINEIKKIAMENPDSNVAQLYKVTAENLPLFQGFAYRLRKIVESSDITYLASIWALRKFKQTSSFRAPYVEALFDTLTTPNPGVEIPVGSDQKGMFETVADLQDWLVKYAIPRFQNTVNVMRRIANDGDIDRAVMIFDVELLFPKTTVNKYDKEEDKTWVLTAGQILGLASTFENYIGLMYYWSTYDLEVAGEMSNQLRTETFLDHKGANSRLESIKQIGERAELISPRRVAELISPTTGKNEQGKFGRNSRSGASYKNFLTIRPIAKKRVADFSNYLEAAKASFIAAAEDSLEYHEHNLRLANTLSEEDARQMAIDPKIYYHTTELTPRVDEGEVIKNTIELLKNGQKILNDRVLNKTYVVNTDALFNIEKMNDLRNFYPNNFDTNYPQRIPLQAPAWHEGGLFGNAKMDWVQSFHWNYSYSKYISWPDPTFGGFLPNTDKEKRDDSMYLHLVNVSSLPEIPYAGLWLSMFYAY